MKNPYRENPFAVLQLSPATTNAEINAKAEKMRALIEIGEITEITKAQVVQAQRQLLRSDKRIREELFYCYLGTTDQNALRDFLAKWSGNPLQENTNVDLIADEWTEEELQTDFSSLAAYEAQPDPDGTRFDDQEQNNQLDSFFVNLPVPEFDPATAVETGPLPKIELPNRKKLKK